MWMQAGYNGGVPISHEFFIRQMSGKLNYVIADELMPEMEEKMRVEMMDEKEARYRKWVRLEESSLCELITCFVLCEVRRSEPVDS